MNEFLIYKMEIKIDRENKIVFFEEDYPSCMDIPEIMRAEYPSFTPRVLSCLQFNELDFPVVGRRVLWEE